VFSLSGTRLALCQGLPQMSSKRLAMPDLIAWPPFYGGMVSWMPLSAQLHLHLTWVTCGRLVCWYSDRIIPLCVMLFRRTSSL